MVQASCQARRPKLPSAASRTAAMIPACWRGPVQGRILLEHGDFQIAQRRAGIDPQLLGQRPATPQGKRGPQLLHAFGRVSGLPGAPQELLGLPHVGTAVEIKHVARGLGADRRLAAEHAAQVRHVTLQRVTRGRWGGGTPHHLNQAVDADDLAVTQGQRG
jgi:hypothetical protein